MKQSFLVQLAGVVVICGVVGLAGGVILALVSGDARQIEDDAPRPVLGFDLYPPTRVPDRVVLTWTGDPATSQTVTWRTSVEVVGAVAEVAVAEAGPGFAHNARRVEATTRAYQTDYPLWHVHTAEFKDLAAGTVHAYRVGDGVNWSEWFEFRTAPAVHERFSFIYLGDAQNDVRSLWSRVVRRAFADAPDAAFVLHAGDLVNQAENDTQWAEWHAAAGWIHATIPLIATPGNHEYSFTKHEGVQGRWLTRHWNTQFAFPVNGPAELPGSAYTIDYQNLRVISLNSNERQAEQVEWLEQALEHDRTWTVVTFHHPLYSPARGRDNTPLRELWMPVLARHAVDLILTGHDHAYGRTGPLGAEAGDGSDGGPIAATVAGSDSGSDSGSGTGSRSAPGGTIHVVSVSGPKMYELDAEPRKEIRRAAEDTQLYQIVWIEGNTLRYEARTALGETYDAFTLKKHAGRPNELLEETPALPERRRPVQADP